MALRGMLFHQQLLLGLIILAATATAASQDSQPNSSCIYCGSLCIHYPFGTRSSHYLDESFLINCDNTSGTPKPTLAYDQNLEVLNISLEGELRLSTSVTRDCPGNYSQQKILSKFPISNKRNNLIGVGFSIFSYILGSSKKIYGTGCVSVSDLSDYDYDTLDEDRMANGSCSGVGCCNTSIPEEVTNFTVGIYRFVSDTNTCKFGFVVEKEAYNFSTLDLDFLQNRTTVPVVLDWAVGNETCLGAQRNSTSYACKAEHSECYNSTNGPGYRCNCSPGFQGNPYVIHGCQDINECEISNPCIHTCQNLEGGFKCSCPKGHDGDGKKNGTHCYPKGQSRGVIIALCIGIISFLALFFGGSWIFWVLKRRKYMKLKEKFFQQNGGLLLKQQLSNHQNSFEKTKIFTAEELKKATNNYDESRVIGQGGFGTVYKGVLSDNSVVAIKKSKIADQSQIEQFINEVIVLTQIRHRNVVQLFGCCLETEVPLLVYEFITNGTLYEHIHDKDRSSLLSWEKRLKITTDSAEALAYLHYATSMPIIHRDVKTTNILLDDNYTAKVADFGASRLVPLDQTQLNTLVQGTLGYLDPEYMQTSQLTEKSDVYSFGVVMAELITGKKALSFDRPEVDRNLAIYFVTAIKEDHLVQILEEHIVNEGKIEQLKEVANLAKRCLSLRGEDRPSMKEVTTELERLRSLEKHPLENINVDAKKTEYFLNATSRSFNIDVSTGCSTSSTLEYDSMKDQILKPMDDGR